MEPSIPPKWKCCPYLVFILGEQIEKQIKNAEVNQEELLKVIESLTDFIMMCDLQLFSCTEMELAGSIIIELVSYVCNCRTSDILNVIRTLIQYDNKSNVEVLPDQLSKPVAIRHCINFRRAIMVGLRHITWNASDVEAAAMEYDRFTCYVLVCLVQLIDFNTYTSIAIAKTFVTTLEKHKDMLLPIAKNTIFTHTIEKVLPTQMTIKPYLHKIYYAIMKLASHDTLEKYLAAIVCTPYSNCSSFFIIEALVKYLPLSIVEKYSLELMLWILRSISNQSIAPFAKKLSKVLILKFPFRIYKSIFHPFISMLENTFLEPQKGVFKKNILTHVYAYALMKYRNDFITLHDTTFKFDLNPETMEHIYIDGELYSPVASLKTEHLSQLIMLGIQCGCIKVLDYTPLIETFFSVDSLECCSNSFRAICFFSKKTDPLTNWHLERFHNFLVNIAMNELCVEMRFFFSHLLIQMHIIKNEDLLDDYKRFIYSIKEFMFSYMKEKTDFGKGVLIYTALSSVFIKKQLKLRYTLTKKEQEMIANDEVIYFTLDSIYDDEILESLKIEFACKNLNVGVMLNCFEELFLLRLTIQDHQDLLIWAFNLLQDGMSVKRENITKMIVIHLKFLSVENPESFKLVTEEIVNKIYNDVNSTISCPCSSYLAVLAAMYKQGFCDEIDKGRIIDLTHKVIVGLELLIRCSKVANVTKKVKKLLGDFHLNPVEAECTIRYGFDFLGHVALKTKDECIITELVKISNMIISSTNMRKAITEAAAQLRKICIHIMYPDLPPITKVLIFQLYWNPSLIRRIIVIQKSGDLLNLDLLFMQSPHLTKSMSFLVDVIKHNRLSDYSMTTSVNCLQALVENPTVTLEAQRYIQTILIQSISLISKPNWELKNSILQLLRSFLNTSLGQSSGGLRPLNIEVIYFLYPEVVRFLFRKFVGLDGEVTPDSTIAILSFFLMTIF